MDFESLDKTTLKKFYSIAVVLEERCVNNYTIALTGCLAEELRHMRGVESYTAVNRILWKMHRCRIVFIEPPAERAVTIKIQANFWTLLATLDPRAA